MTTQAAPRELLVVRVDAPSAQFEGRIVGALERAESGDAIRVVEALVVARDRESGELAATRVAGGAGSLVTAVTDFRLDPSSRGRLTAEALGGEEAGADAAALRDLGADLEPGAALVAILLEHAWHATLMDAVAQSGGRAIADDLVEPAGDEDLARRALAVVRGHGGA